MALLLSYRIVMDRHDGRTVARQSCCESETVIVADDGQLVRFDCDGRARPVRDLSREERIRARIQCANGVHSMTLEVD
jgi:hypothetical protein